MTKVLLTRTEPGIQRLAERLLELNIESILSPLLTIKHTPPPFSSSEYDIAIISSPHAMNAAKAYQHIPLAIVGKQLADTAIKDGFRVINTAETMTSLCAQLRDTTQLSKEKILYIAGKDISASPSRHLPDAKVNHLIVYEAALKRLTNEAIHELQNRTLTALTLQSSRTAAHFAREVDHIGLIDSLSTVVAICQSKVIAEQINHLPWRKILVAEAPTEASLIAMISSTYA